MSSSTWCAESDGRRGDCFIGYVSPVSISCYGAWSKVAECSRKRSLRPVAKVLDRLLSLTVDRNKKSEVFWHFGWKKYHPVDLEVVGCQHPPDGSEKHLEHRDPEGISAWIGGGWVIAWALNTSTWVLRCEGSGAQRLLNGVLELGNALGVEEGSVLWNSTALRSTQTSLRQSFNHWSAELMVVGGESVQKVLSDREDWCGLTNVGLCSDVEFRNHLDHAHSLSESITNLAALISG